MSDDIRCPQCGEDDELIGERSIVDDTEVIMITCQSCATVWQRSFERRCQRCEGTDMFPVPVAIIEKSRGSQLSIMGTRPEYLCWICDRDLIDDQRRSGTAVMPDELPTL